MTKKRAWQIVKRKAFPYRSILSREEEKALEILEEIMIEEIRKEKKYKEFEKKLRKALDS